MVVSSLRKASNRYLGTQLLQRQAALQYHSLRAIFRAVQGAPPHAPDPFAAKAQRRVDALRIGAAKA